MIRVLYAIPHPMYRFLELQLAAALVVALAVGLLAAGAIAPGGNFRIVVARIVAAEVSGILVVRAVQNLLAFVVAFDQEAAAVDGHTEPGSDHIAVVYCVQILDRYIFVAAAGGNLAADMESVL